MKTKLMRLCAPWMALLLAACGGGGGGESPPAPEPRERSARLAVSRPGELTTYVQARLRARGTATPPLSDTMLPAPTAAAAPPPRSSTTLQEAGVDEPDLLKSDGHALYAMHSSAAGQVEVDAYTRDANGRAVKQRTLALPSEDAISADPAGLVLGAGDEVLAAITRHWHRTDDGGVICPDVCPTLAASIMPTMLRSSVSVQRIEVGEVTTAAVGTRLSIDGDLVASRRVGDTLLLVTRHWPRLPVDALPANASAAQREAAIAATTAADVLPRMRRNGGAATALLRDSDCWIQPANGSTLIHVTTVTMLDLRAAGLAPKSRCFVGGSEAVYMTPEHLYIATTRWVYTALNSATFFPAEMRTDIHKFAFAAGDIGYRASGEVSGHLGWSPEMNSYRFSEWNGDLRVLTYTGSVGWGPIADGSRPPSPARLTVLRERTADQTLQPLATLPNAKRPATLGKPGEQVRAVRFIGSRGYVVTFRTIDPLYVLDLADPADPKVAGELEVPGFSDQLLPMADGLLLGVGHAVSDNGRIAGVKLSLFDVADPAQPRELSTYAVGMAGSRSALDHTPHGVNWLVHNGVARVALPAWLTVTDNGGAALQGLLRVEVDLNARTLRPRDPLDLVGPRASDNLANDRSLQIGDQLYYARSGSVATYDW